MKLQSGAVAPDGADDARQQPRTHGRCAADAQLAMGCVGQGTQFIDGLTKLLKDSRCTTQQNLAVRSRGNAAIGAIE
jgi:hypothetical protein